MSFRVGVVCAVLALVPATSHAAQFRAAIKMTCVDAGAGDPPSLNRVVLKNPGVLDLINAGEPFSAHEIVFDTAGQGIAVVRRCDGLFEAPLTGTAVTQVFDGPEKNGKAKTAGQYFLSWSVATWGGGVEGALECPLTGVTGTSESRSGTCVGAVHASGGVECQVQVKVGGLFTPKNDCPPP
jgi:hypothetical protein